MKKIIIFLLPSILLLLSCQADEGNQKPKSDSEKKTVVFIGTYTQKEGHVDGKAEGIYVYELDAATGQLNYKSTMSGISNPSFLTVHPNGQFVYAVNEYGDRAGTVTALRFDAENNQLSLLNTTSSRGKAPCYISTDANGEFAFVANYSTGNICLLAIQENGSLGDAISAINHPYSKLQHSRQEAAHAHYFAPDLKGQYAYALDLGADKVFIYQVDTLNRGLVSVGEQKMMGEAAGPRHLSWHPQREWVYIVNELNGTIEAYKKENKKPQLIHFQTISTISDSTGTNASCADIHITPNGKFLYASNRGAHNNLAMYRIDEKNGTLIFIGHQSTHGKTPRNFRITPDGKFLLVANQDSDNIVTFKINPQTGVLEETGIQTSVKTPVCLRYHSY